MKKLILIAILLPLLSFGQNPGLLHFGLRCGFGFITPMNSKIQTDSNIFQEYLPGHNYGARFGIGKRVQLFVDLLYLNEQNSFRQMIDSVTYGKNITSKYYEIPVGLRLRVGNKIMETGVSALNLISSKEIVKNLDKGDKVSEDITKSLEGRHYRVFVTVGNRFIKKPEVSLCVRFDFTFTPTSMEGYPYTLIKERYVYTGSAFFVLQVML